MGVIKKHYKEKSIFFGVIAIVLMGCFIEGEENTEAKENTIGVTVVDPDSIFGYPPMNIPANNLLTKEGVALGRMLFYDPILSKDSTQSCAGCHAQKFGFSDNGKQFSTGVDGSKGGMNAPIIVNPGWNKENFWDGRAVSLEAQALGPVTNPIEMASPSWSVVVEKIKTHSQYPDLFKKAFGEVVIDSILVVKAIAQFERTFVSRNSKFDRNLRGEYTFTEEEKKGFFAFFEETKGDCFHCHVENTYYDNSYHNNGIDSVTAYGTGLGGVTGDTLDDGKWKTPTLRNVEYSAPYMHDGRFKTLEEVLDHYSEGVKISRNVDPLITKRYIGKNPKITEEDKRLIIIFLKTLSDSDFVNNKELSNPFK